MQTDEAMKPSGSPVPGVIPESVGVCDDSVAAHTPFAAKPTTSAPTKPASSADRRNPASLLLAKLLSVIRGDKYLVGAYPPAWHSATALRDGDHVVRQNNDSGAAAHVQSVVAPDSNPAMRAEPREPETKEH